MSSQRYARALLSGAAALRNTARLQVGYVIDRLPAFMGVASAKTVKVTYLPTFQYCSAQDWRCGSHLL